MEVTNCKGCGKLFNYLSGPQLCPTCVKALDLKFEQVKEFVYDNPGVGIQEVSDEMEVSVSQIKKWIREEKLSFSDDSMIGLECEGCGATIKTGRFCKVCKDQLARGLQNAYPKPKPEPEKKKEPKDNPKMRYFT